MTLKVACAQIAPFKGDLERNLDTIAASIQQSASEGVDLVAFPETAVSGYFLEGGVLEKSLTSEQLLKALSSRLHLERPIDAIIGFYEQEESMLYNSAAYLEFGPEPRLVHTYRKFFLPTYGVFDEERFVSRGRQLGVFDSRLGRIAILICEDIWHSVLSTLAAVAGATIMVVPSASPARGFESDKPQNLERYQRMVRAVAEEHGLFCLNCQLCGFEGGKGFVGGSMIVGPDGTLIAQGPVQAEYLLTAEIDLAASALARAQTPLLSDLQSAWGDITRIVCELDRHQPLTF